MKLQKIIRCLSCSVRLNFPWSWIKLQKIQIHILPNFQNGKRSFVHFCKIILHKKYKITKLSSPKVATGAFVTQEIKLYGCKRSNKKDYL